MGGRILCLFFGGMAVVAGVTMMGDTLYLVQAGLHTTGVIVANERVWTGRGGHRYYPVVRFVARGGQTYVVRSTFGADPPEFRPGEKVTVYYDAQYPQRALIDSDHLWLVPVALLVLGTVFGLGGAWPLLPRRRRSTPTHTRKSTIRPRQNLPARRSSTKSQVRTQHKSTTRSRRNSPARRRT